MFQVAELVATLRLDKGNYDSGLASSAAQMSQFKGGAESLGSTLSGALAGGMRAAAVTASALAVSTGAILKSTLATGIAYNTLQQTSRAALTTLMGGAKQANEQMDKLDVFAKTSPFSKSVFIEAQQQLIGFGAAGDRVIPMLSAVNDAVAAIGGTNDDIGSISSSLADVIGTGKITGDTLNELGTRGINAADIIAKGFGTTSEDIRDSITKGTIDSSKALDILVDGMAKKFAGAGANVKNTMTGATDRVKSATRDIGAALAEPFVSKYGGGRLVQWSNDWADALRALEKRAPAVVSLFMDRLSPAFNGVSVKIGELKSAIKGFDMGVVAKGFDTLASNLPAVAALTGAVVGLTSGALAGIPVIGGLLGAVNPLAAALVGAALASPELRAAFADLFGAVGPLLPAAADLASALSGALTDALTGAVPLVEGATEILKVLIAVLIPIVGVVADAARAFGELSPELQTMVVGFMAFMAIRGSLVTGFGAVQTAVGGLVTKLKTGGLAGALSGLLSMFGGPWVLAIGAAVGALSFFAAQQSEAKHRIEDFTASLDQNTGAITANTSVMAGEKLMDYADTFKAIRLNVKDAADAVANGGKPYVDMVNKINNLNKAVMDYNMTQGQGGNVHQQAERELIRIAAAYGINEEAAKKLNAGGLTQLLGGMTSLRGEVTTSTDGWKTQNESVEKAEPTTLRLSEAIRKVGDSTANTTDRLRAYQDIIDAMNGKSKTAEQSQRDLSKTSRDLVGFLSEVDATGQRVNASMAFAADGSIAFNDAGDRLNSMLEPLATRAQTAALAAIDLAKAQGRTEDASRDAEAALKPFRDSLQALADQGLLSQAQVDALSKSLFGVPGETTAVISDDGSAGATKIKIDELTAAVKATPDKTITITEPMSDFIKQKLHDLGYTVTTLPNGNIKVTETGAAETGAIIDGVASKPRGSSIFATALTATAEAQLNEAARRRDAVIRAIYEDSGGSGYVAQRRQIPQAEGHIVDFYANGGVRHPRLTPMSPLAQIVPQNTWRVVGDRMDVPELYAPLDGSARSLALLREGAQRSGFDMVPRGAMRYHADGGFHGANNSVPAQQMPAPVLVEGRPTAGEQYIFSGPVTFTDVAEAQARAKQEAQDLQAVYGMGSIARGN